MCCVRALTVYQQVAVEEAASPPTYSISTPPTPPPISLNSRLLHSNLLMLTRFPFNHFIFALLIFLRCSNCADNRYLLAQ